MGKFPQATGKFSRRIASFSNFCMLRMRILTMTAGCRRWLVMRPTKGSTIRDAGDQAVPSGCATPAFANIVKSTCAGRSEAFMIRSPRLLRGPRDGFLLGRCVVERNVAVDPGWWKLRGTNGSVGSPRKSRYRSFVLRSRGINEWIC